MSLYKLNKKLFEITSILAIIFITFYFALTALYGKYGLFVLFQRQAEKEILFQINSELSNEIQVWENLTKRMSGSYLDLDLLDEQARKILRVARSGDAILFY